jgi:small subunit ribosomal protein S1
LSLFLGEHPKGSIVSGVVQDVDAKMATVTLEGGIVGQLRASEIARDRVEDARTALKPGETIEAKITGVDRKTRVVSLSIKAKEAHEEAQAIQNYKSEAGRTTTGTTLGDLLKEQMNPE